MSPNKENSLFTEGCSHITIQ